MKVSIIIPIFNAEKHLSKCIDSVLNQSYKNFEIILIDDGSLDNSSKICKKYEKKYEFIHYYKKNNGGPSSARNLGIIHSKGEYIMFIDCDDYIDNNMLYNMLKNSYNCDIIISNYKIKDNNKVKYLEKKIYNKDNFIDFIIINRLWGPVCKLIKKNKILKLFNENYSIGEDLLFWYENKDNIKTFKYINDYSYNYIQNSGSLMNTNILKLSNLKSFEIFNYIINDTESECIKDNIKKTYIDNYLNYKKIDKNNYLSNSYKKDFLKYYKDIIFSKNITIKNKIKITIKIIISRRK